MKEIDVDRMVDTYGNMPGDLLNIGFLLLNPARLMLDKYIGFLENAHNRDFLENFLRMEKWIFDSPDVPGKLSAGLSRIATNRICSSRKKCL